MKAPVEGSQDLAVSSARLLAASEASADPRQWRPTGEGGAAKAGDRFRCLCFDLRVTTKTERRTTERKGFHCLCWTWARRTRASWRFPHLGNRAE